VEEVILSDQSKIVIQVSEYGGRTALDIRTHVTTDKYSGYTKKGVNVPIEKGKELVEKITKVLQGAG